MANFQRNKQLLALQAASPREQLTKLQDEVAAALKREGAKTSVPCPIADQIFDQLFGRLWLQGSVIKEFSAAEDLLNIIKLDYDATVEFYRQRRENTFRKTVHAEDDQELKELYDNVREAETRLSNLHEKLNLIERKESEEMTNWLDKFGITQLVHMERMKTLKFMEQNLEFRTNLLNDKSDVLEGADKVLEWASSALEDDTVTKK